MQRTLTVALLLCTILLAACAKTGTAAGGDFATQFTRNWKLVDYLREGKNIQQQLEAELARINSDSSKTEEWKAANRSSVERIYGDLQAQLGSGYLHVSQDNANFSCLGQNQMGKWVLNTEGRRSIDIQSQGAAPLTLFVVAISDSTLELETLSNERLVFKAAAQ